VKGRIKDRPLELIVQEIQSRMPSGVLTLERGPAKKQICFLKGTIRFAASNLQEDRFGEFLIRSGILPEPTVRGAEEQVAPGQRLGEYLLASGLLSPDDMHEATRSHILGIIVPCFEWRSGDYRYEEGVPNIVGEFATDIPVIELALERARRQVSEKDVTKLLNDGNAALLPPSLPERDLQKLKLTKAETLIMARAEEGERLSEVLAVSPALRAEMARAAAALLACGIVGTAGASADKGGNIYDTIPPALKARGKKVSEETPSAAGVRYYKQMHDLLIGADHYKTLGLETTATAEDVRRSYYTLAKEIHPDRFLSPPLDALHQEMEELFAQVLEAYNTLVNPDSRGRYDAERAAKGMGPKQPAGDQQALARVNFLRGRGLFEEGKPAEALRFLQNAVEIEPNRAEYQRLLGIVQSRNPRLRLEAEASLLKAIDLEPARADGYLQLGLLYRRMGETEKAVEKLRECLKWDPANLEAGTALAELTRTVGKNP
jgi:curved DNA-binding protein CbpA